MISTALPQILIDSVNQASTDEIFWSSDLFTHRMRVGRKRWKGAFGSEGSIVEWKGLRVGGLGEGGWGVGGLGIGDCGLGAI